MMGFNDYPGETTNLPDLVKRYNALTIRVVREFKVGKRTFFLQDGFLYSVTTNSMGMPYAHKDYNELNQKFQQALERQVADAVTEAIREAEERLIALRALVTL